MSSAKKTPPKRRTWLRRARRILLVLILLAVGALAGLWAWLESDAGQERMRLWLEDRASAALQRDVRIGSLDWDLLPFNAGLSQLEIAGPPDGDQPLLRARALYVRIDPWALLSRELRLQAVEIDEPVVHWDADSDSNLALEAGGGGALSVTVGSLAIDDGAVEINHRRWQLDSTLAAVSLRLQPVTGAAEGSPRRSGLLRIGSGGLRLESEDPEVAGATPRAIDLVEAEVPFAIDEDLLRIELARVSLGDSLITASGTLTEWRRLRLAVEGRLEVSDLVALTGITLATGDGGTIRLDGDLTWGPEAPRFTGTLSAPTLRLAGIEATDLTANLEAGPERVTADDLSLSMFAGTLAADVALDLTTRSRTWTVRYQARDVDLNELSSSPALPGFRFAGTAAASGELTWSDPIRDTITGAGSFDLDLPGATLEGLAQRAVTAADAGTVATSSQPAAAPSGADASIQRVAPSLPLPVTAHADFELDAGSMAISDATASLPNNRASLEARVGRDGDIAATVRVESDDLRILDRFFNQIRRFRGERPVPQPIGIEGNGLATATIGGSLDAPTLDGTLETRSLSVANNPIGDIDGNLRLAGAALEIRDLRLRRDGGTGQGEGRLRIGQRVESGPDYSFGLRLESFPMQVSLPRVGVPLEAAGRTSGEIAISGSYGGATTGLVTLRGEAVRLNQLDALSADVRVRLDPDEWIAERFELRGAEGALTVSGSWRRDDDTVQAQLEAIDLDASAVGALTGNQVPISGTLDLQATLTGAFSAPDAAATLRWTEAGTYGVALGAVAASAELRGGSLAVSAVGRSGPDAPAVPPPTPTAAGGTVPIPIDAIPAGGWAATLSADLRAPRRATVRASGASDLALALLATQGYDTDEQIDVSGAIDAEGSGVLGDWRAWEGTAVLSDFVLTRPGLSFSIPQPMRLELGEQQLRIDLPELVSEAGSLQANGVIDLQTGRWLEATSRGLISLDVLGTLSDELDASGTLEVDLEATGEVLAGEVAGSFELYDVTVAHADSPWAAEGVNGTVLLADNSIDLRDVGGTLAGAPFTIDGDLPLAALTGDDGSEPFAVELSIDALPLAPLWEKTGPLHELITGGEAAVTASLRGRGTDWRSYQGRVDVRRLIVDLTDLRLSTSQPAALVIDGERLEVIDPIVLQGPGTDLRVSGAFLLAPFRLDARLQGAMALDPLNAITGDWGVAGRAELDVGVSGNPPAIAYDGQVTISNGLLNAPVLQPIENVSARLTLQNRLVRIERFAGSLGDATATRSNVTATGEIQLLNSVPQGFVIELDVDEVLLRIQRGIRLAGSADLLLEGTVERSLLSGVMNVSEGEYTQRWEGEDAIVGLSRGGAMAGIDHPLARSVSLDLDLLAPGELRIVNNMADVELSADLQVRGTLANPVILGSATVLDGSVMFRDQRYRFLRGSVEFQNPLRTEPSFDIALETSIRQYLVTLNASGSPARGDINTNFVSSPPLSDLQLIQLLTTGSAPDEDTRSDDETLSAVGAQAASFLTSQYLSQVERGAQQVFGIDRFNVEPAVVTGSGDPTARVTLGKQVTPDLWVSWTTVIGTTDEQLVSLEYQLTRGIRITATREEDGSLGIDFRIDHRFR